jgi:hypothetical protein
MGDNNFQNVTCRLDMIFNKAKNPDTKEDYPNEGPIKNILPENTLGPQINILL